MNALSLDSTEYRNGMQQAAVNYLQRNRELYLPGDDQLFTSCVAHLVNAWEVPQFLAEQLGQLAWGEFERRRTTVIGIDLARGADTSAVWLIDPRTNERWPIPVRVLPQHLIDRLGALPAR